MYRFVAEDAAPEQVTTDEVCVPELPAELREYVKAGDTFTYRYGPWTVALKVSRCLPLEIGVHPCCTRSEGAAPPEEVGGVSAYQDFLRIVQDPKDPQYREMRQLAGEAWFQPDTVEKVNERIKDLHLQ